MKKQQKKKKRKKRTKQQKLLGHSLMHSPVAILTGSG